jgi:hypothetical protein
MPQLKVGAIFCVILLCAAAHAQGPTVAFTLDFSGSNPSHYEIVANSDGKGSYTSNGQLSHDSEPADPVVLEFTLSETVRARIFDLAKKAHYFEGKIDSGRTNLANTGNKTLIYKDSSRNSQATYNYSPVQPVQDLTTIFQGLSTTLEFGRRLTYFQKYQKLALDEDLKRMEQMQREKNLGDLQAIAAVLESIADDTSVMNVSRSRALRLLALAGK